MRCSFHPAAFHRRTVASVCRQAGLAGLFLVAAGFGCKRDAVHVSREVPGEAASGVPASSLCRFVDVTAAAGINHRHFKPILDHKLDNIMTWMASVGAAAAAGDFDNDGWLDLYVTNSRKGKPNYLYRNNGDGTFIDVALSAGVAYLNGDKGTSMDAVWADYDNDGWIDLYVVRWGEDVLFRNNGDGTFADVTEQCFRKRDGSPGTQWANGNAVIFWDFNLDGRLDLYVGNYFDEVDLWHLESTRVMHDDFENARNGGRNFLYKQQPDGTFVEVAESLGLEDPGWTLAVGSADINNDGWADLYCGDDFGPDQLFLGKPGGTFTNVTAEAIGFDTKKGMNVDFGDFNNDGWLDIYVTNITTSEYLQEGNMLWHNDGPGTDGKLTLTDVSLETITYDGGWGWGAKFFDYDHDGDLDIIALNGFISAGEGNYWYDLASWTVTGSDSADAANWPAIGNRSFSGYEKVRLWRNDGRYSFLEVADEAGVGNTRDGRGVVTFDYDNDGDLDLFIANQDQPPILYRNDLAGDNHWLMIELEVDPATGVNRDGIGTRVTLLSGGGRQIRERDGGSSFSGQSDPRLHFGLGADDRVSLLEVRWPDGGLQYLEDIPVDRHVVIRQDRGVYASQLAIAVGPPKPWKRSTDGGTPGEVPIDPVALDRQLTEFETHLRERPAEFAPASAYRKHCARYDQHDRAIKFLKSLVTERPDDERARIELGCAYVDKIPTRGGLAAIVSKGSLAKKSLNQLDKVIARHPDMWAAYYCRGMNHLHWPRALRHSDDAVVDFEKCLELQRKRGVGHPRPYYVRAHLGLGDAHAKAKQYDKARDAWRAGLELFPKSKELVERLAITDNGKLLEFVESKRSLEQPIDTGLGFLDIGPHETSP
ncbi:MAG: VCBS repeat-containing protein [Planctomycetes bacterium]|nr:VCBS repeat-containing protein [Planctomycetota bacterium]